MQQLPDFKHIKYVQSDGVAEVVLDRPDKLNALGIGPGSNRDEIVAALALADADDKVGAIVISANGSAFCAGGDLEGLPPANTSFDHFQFGEALNDFHRRVRETRKPTIAAVHGLCLGAGLGFIAQCDFVLLSEDARLGLVEGRFGAPGAAEIVPLVGPAWAKFLILTGEMIDAKRSVEIGLALLTLPKDILWEKALDLGRRIARMPRESALLNKASIDAIAEAMGRGAGRYAARGQETLTRSMAPLAKAPDGRLFSQIIKQDGIKALKEARDLQYSRSWFADLQS